MLLAQVQRELACTPRSGPTGAGVCSSLRSNGSWRVLLAQVQRELACVPRSGSRAGPPRCRKDLNQSPFLPHATSHHFHSPSQFSDEKPAQSPSPFKFINPQTPYKCFLEKNKTLMSDDKHVIRNHRDHFEAMLKALKKNPCSLTYYQTSS